MTRPINLWREARPIMTEVSYILQVGPLKERLEAEAKAIEEQARDVLQYSRSAREKLESRASGVRLALRLLEQEVAASLIRGEADAVDAEVIEDDVQVQFIRADDPGADPQ